MEPIKSTAFTPTEAVRMELRSFVNEGLKDVQNSSVYSLDDAFTEIERRYKIENL